MSWLLTWFRFRSKIPSLDHHEITIEKYFLRKDLYRITTGKDPLPLPRIKSAVQNIVYQKTFDDILPEIQKVVHSYVTEEHRIILCEVTKANYPKSGEKKVALIIDINQSSGPPTRWLSMMNSLKLLFKPTKLESIDIEVVDEIRASVLTIYPEAVQSESVICYESVRSKLIAFLLKRLPNLCHGMSCFKLGGTFETAIPSIVIFVEPFSKQNWESLTSQLRFLLPSNSTQLEVEFVPGRISQLIGKDFRRDKESFDWYLF